MLRRGEEKLMESSVQAMGSSKRFVAVLKFIVGWDDLG